MACNGHVNCEEWEYVVYKKFPESERTNYIIKKILSTSFFSKTSSSTTCIWIEKGWSIIKGVLDHLIFIRGCFNLLKTYGFFFVLPMGF